MQKVVLDTLTVFRLVSSLLYFFFLFNTFFDLKIYNTQSTAIDVSDCSFGRKEPITANFHQTHRYILLLMFETLFDLVFLHTENHLILIPHCTCLYFHFLCITFFLWSWKNTLYFIFISIGGCMYFGVKS